MTSAAPDLPPAGAAGSTSDVDVDQLNKDLAAIARRVWPELPVADLAASVEAGVLSVAVEQAQRLPQSDRQPDRLPEGRATAAVAGAASAVQRQGIPPNSTASVDWTRFGLVIPVLAGSPGAGASVLTAVIADALQLAGRNVLVVDAADPARSGLATAARHAGPWVKGPHPAVCIRYSWRAKTLLAQLATWLPVVAPGMVPPPRFWCPGISLHVTVVDLGHDSWRLAAHPLSGAGEWLRRGSPTPRPVLVVRPSRPSLLHAEQVLSRLEPWISIGTLAAPAQLVVMGAKRWPVGVVGSAGRRIAGLVPDAVFVPHDAAIAVGGVTTQVMPSRLRSAVLPVLRRWGAVEVGAGRGSGTAGRS